MTVISANMKWHMIMKLKIIKKIGNEKTTCCISAYITYSILASSLEDKILIMQCTICSCN